MYIYSFYQLFFCISYISYHPNMLKIMFLVLHFVNFAVSAFPAADSLHNCAAWDKLHYSSLVPFCVQIP